MKENLDEEIRSLSAEEFNQFKDDFDVVRNAGSIGEKILTDKFIEGFRSNDVAPRATVTDPALLVYRPPKGVPLTFPAFKRRDVRK